MPLGEPPPSAHHWLRKTPPPRTPNTLPTSTYVNFRALSLTALLLLACPSLSDAQNATRTSRNKASAGDQGLLSPLAALFPRRKTPPQESEAAGSDSGKREPGNGKSSAPVAAKSGDSDQKAPPKKAGRQKRIFILGDSQGHTEFGAEFQKQLLLGGHEVIYHAVKNGSPYYWSGLWDSPVLTRIFAPASNPEEAGQWSQVSMPPRTVTQYVETYDPDVFIFQAGTNFELDLAKEATVQISDLVRQSVDQASARGAKVLWIGPPDARDDVKSDDYQKRAARTLSAALAGISAKQGADCFFDSRAACPMPNDSAGDGEHPGPAAARAWASQAAAWTLDQMRGIETRRSSPMRKPADAKPSPVPGSLLDSLTQIRQPSGCAMKLKLLAKSRIEDPKTMAYTDAFSVFKYELENPDEVLKRLKGVTLTTAASGKNPQKPYQVYVLHWTAHNDGKKPATTRIAGWKEGSTVSLKLTPLDQHPLRKALATMRQYNDFDDFDAPIFVASNLLEERAF